MASSIRTAGTRSTVRSRFQDQRNCPTVGGCERETPTTYGKWRSGWSGSGGGLGQFDQVYQQHAPGEQSDPTRRRGQVPGHLGNGRVDVADELRLAAVALHPGQPDVDDG